VAQLDSGQKTQAETHLEHAVHVFDAGGVEAQRLVESNRILPSPKGAHARQREMRGTQMAQRQGRVGSTRGMGVA